MGKLVRPKNDRVIAGVLSGFARHFGINLALLRIVVVAVTLFTFIPLVVYIAAAIIIPKE